MAETAAPMSATALLHWQEPMLVSGSFIMPGTVRSMMNFNLSSCQLSPDGAHLRVCAGGPGVAGLLLPPLRHILHRPAPPHRRGRRQGLRLRHGQGRQGGGGLRPAG